MAKNEKSQRKTIEEVRVATREDKRRIAAKRDAESGMSIGETSATLAVTKNRSRQRNGYIDCLYGLVNAGTTVPRSN
jgi:hypothetical protein